jgi:hypothetical protein
MSAFNWLAAPTDSRNSRNNASAKSSDKALGLLFFDLEAMAAESHPASDPLRSRSHRVVYYENLRDTKFAN